jgi:hypothetical protein
MKFVTELRSQRRRSSARGVPSECWVYTRSAGLREITLSSAQQTLNVGGEVLRPWYLLDATTIGCAVATVYSLEPPSADLRATVLRLARERFQNRAWYKALTRQA